MTLNAEQVKVRDERRDWIIQNLIEQMSDWRYLNVIAENNDEAKVLRFRQLALIRYAALGESKHLVVDAFFAKFKAEVLIPPTVWLQRVVESEGVLAKWIAAMKTGVLHWTDRQWGKNWHPILATENFSAFSSVVPNVMSAWGFMGFIGGEHSSHRDLYHPLYEDAIRIKRLVEAWYQDADVRQTRTRTIYSYWECMIGFAAWAATATQPVFTIGTKEYRDDKARTYLADYIRGWEAKGMGAFDVSSLPVSSIQTSIFARMLDIVVESAGTVSIDGNTDPIELAQWVQFKPTYQSIPLE